MTDGGHSATFLSLFSGVGGLDLGLERAGWQCVGQVEIDKACRDNVLARHYPDVPRWADITEVDPDDLPAADLVCGGFPCQDISVAGRRAGLAGTRSGLWWQFHRVLAAVCPRWIIVENVPGLLSSNNGRDMGAILGALGDLGYMGASRVLDAQHFGLAQRRRRVFIVGCFGDRAAPVQVLLEPEGGQGHPAPRRTAGQGVASSLTAGVAATRGISAPGRRGEDDVNLVAYGAEVTPTMPSFNGPRGSTTNPQFTDHALVAYSESGPGWWRDGIGPLRNRAGAQHESTVIAAQCHGSNVGPMGTLKGDGSLGGGVPFVAGTLSTEGQRRAASAEAIRTLVTHALTAEGADVSEDGMGRVTPIRASGAAGANGLGIGRQGAPAPTLDTTGSAAIAGATIRRLTPTECERLQGFPDGWTAGQPDSVRYRQLGNAVAVPVAEWIGHRILEADAKESPLS